MLCAAALPYLVGAPLLTLVVRRLTPHLSGDFLWLALAGPVLLPVLWMLGGASHLAEPGRAHGHILGGACAHPLVFAALVSAPLLATALWLLLGDRRALGRVREAWGDPAAHAIRDAAATVGAARAVPVDGDGLCTRGLLRPRIEVGVELARRLRPDVLRSALAHEHEHALRFDPLRNLVLAVCLRLNPASRMLAGEAGRYRLAEELDRDRAAVARGASPLDLADALVAVARPRSSLASHLGSPNARFLRLRVHLLIGYVDARPRLVRTWGAASLVAILVAMATGPHVVDAWPVHALDRLASVAIFLLLGG